jgi:hypothetical protein
MSSVPQTEVRSTPFARPKHVVFAVIWLMFTYVLYHNERFLINPSDASWPHYRDLSWRLLVHGIFGATALLLIFMQFNDRLRARFLRFHRICGRIYTGAVFVAAPLGVYLAQLDKSIGYTFSFTLVTAVFCELVDVRHGHGFMVYPHTTSRAAPSVDDAKCGNGTRVFRSPSF